MNVLMISLDTTFLAQEGTARSDTLSRHIEIANMLSHLHVIVFSVGRAREPVLRPTEKLSLYPTGSANKLMRVFDGFRIAARICRQHRVDVTTTQDPFFTGMVGYAIRRLYGVPLNVQVHADFFGNRYWISERLLNRLLSVTGRAILRRADNVRVVSQLDKDRIVRRLGIPAERVWPVLGGGGINVEKFSMADGLGIRSKRLPAGCNQMVLFAGRMVKQKRLPDLLHAAARVRRELPGVCFVLVGEGKELPCAKTLCSRLGLDEKVVFTGNVPYDEMPAYFAAADVFLLSSGYEATPRVLMESVAAGLPIVAADVSGASDLVAEGQNGHIVPVGRPGELAKRLIEVLKNVEQYREGAARQKAVLELFNRRRNLPRLLDIYSQIAKGLRV
jgi:glycosyltransferase involved in cell wall biosynthesis